MKKRLFIVVIIFASLTIGTTWAVLQRPANATAKTVVIHGSDLISTDADGGNLAAAIQLFHDQFCGWVVDAKGEKSDPSFKQSSRFWKSAPAPQDAQLVYLRSTTDFNDKKGNPVHLETTQQSGRPIFIMIDYHGEGGPITVTNGLLAELQKMGIAAH